MITAPLPTTEEDIVDIALREAVRQGRIVLSKDDEGRDVYTVVRAN